MGWVLRCPADAEVLEFFRAKAQRYKEEGKITLRPLCNFAPLREIDLDGRTIERLFCLSSRHEPKLLSLLLLLRPALHWEGRSGDGLSACDDDVAP